MPDLNYNDIINMRNDLYQVCSCGGISVVDCSASKKNSTTYCLSYFSSIRWNESRSECNANKFRSTMTYCKVVEEQEHVFTVSVHNSPWCQQKHLHGSIIEQAKSMKFVSSCLHYLASLLLNQQYGLQCANSGLF